MALSQFAKVGLILVAAVLIGVGCKSDPSVSDTPADAGSSAQMGATADAGSGVPEGWQVYSNEEWGVEIAHPGDWYYSERPEEDVGDPNIFIVDFNDEDFFPRETEALYLAAIFMTEPGDIAEALKIPDGIRLVSEELLQTDDGRQVYKQITEDELDNLLPQVVSYTWQKSDRLYEFFGFQDTEELELMAQHFKYPGGE